MKLTLGLKPNIKCPKCGTQPTMETGFWGGLLVAQVMNRLEKEGGSVTCPSCSNKYEVVGTDAK